MEENKKVYIRGCKDRANEIKDILTRLGTNTAECSCNNDHFIYFINHDNEISVALVGSEVAKIIMDNYKEIKLPRRQWKDGDILISNGEPKYYAVFKEYKEFHSFGAYFVLINKTAYFNTSASVGGYHLASEEELENLPPLFCLLMGELNEAGLCLPRKVE